MLLDLCIHYGLSLTSTVELLVREQARAAGVDTPERKRATALAAAEASKARLTDLLRHPERDLGEMKL
jgi:predicted Rdx family selenoprotein